MTSWIESEINPLKGRTRQEILEISARIVEMWSNRSQDVIQESAQHQSEGANIILVSSAYQPFWKHHPAISTPKPLVPPHF